MHSFPKHKGRLPAVHVGIAPHSITFDSYSIEVRTQEDESIRRFVHFDSIEGKLRVNKDNVIQRTI